MVVSLTQEMIESLSQEDYSQYLSEGSVRIVLSDGKIVDAI
jgi:hypothetical protein